MISIEGGEKKKRKNLTDCTGNIYSKNETIHENALHPINSRKTFTSGLVELIISKIGWPIGIISGSNIQGSF